MPTGLRRRTDLENGFKHIVLYLRSITSGLVLTAVIIASAGCSEQGTPKTSTNPDVVAAYKGGEITIEEFDTYDAPPIDDDPQVAEMREEDWRTVDVREIAFRKILMESGTIPDEVVRQASQSATAEILSKAMMWELGWNQIPADMDEIRAEYDAHPETYEEPRKLQLQYIFLRAEVEEMTEEERRVVWEKAASIREEVLSGADFSEMAKMHSESSSSKRAGGFYTVSEDADVFPSFLHGVRDLDVGEISEIIDTPTGYNVAKLVSIIPAFVREFDTQIDHARKMVQREKALEYRAEFVKEFGPKFDLVQSYDRLDDPHITGDASLISVGSWSYSFHQLASELGDHYVVHLYTGAFGRVYEHLDQVTIDALLVREARARELDKRPDIASQIEEAVRQIRYRLELSQRIQNEVSNIPEEEIREFFDQNEQRYKTLRAFDLDVIFLKQEENEESLWQTLKRAEGLVERLRAGEDFAEVARENSKHVSVSNGGRLSTLTSYGIAYQLQPKPAYTALINELEPGEISDPLVAEAYDPKRLVYLQTGVLITRVVNIVEPRQRTYEESREKVAESFRRRNSQTILTNLKDTVIENADLQIYLDHLPAL